MSDLLALAERCEAAEAGSFTLDKEILAALGYTWRGMDYWYRDDSHTWPGMAALTRSLDAAMSLVPEGWRVDWLQHLLDEPLWTCGLYRRAGEIERVVTGPDGAQSAALALCAAALRARAGEQS